jgi:hypothetical protein
VLVQIVVVWAWGVEPRNRGLEEVAAAGLIAARVSAPSLTAAFVAPTARLSNTGPTKPIRLEHMEENGCHFTEA